MIIFHRRSTAKRGGCFQRLYDVRKVSFVPWVVAIGRLRCGVTHMRSKKFNETLVVYKSNVKNGHVYKKMQRIAYSIP